jgi:hypothetical protein
MDWRQVPSEMVPADGNVETSGQLSIGYPGLQTTGAMKLP